MNVLMCCSDLSYKGGMVSVVRGYLDHAGWGDTRITFVPTHREGGKLALAGCFARAYMRVLGMAVRRKIDTAHLHVAERGSFIRKGLLLHTLRLLGIKTVLHHHGAEFEDYYARASALHKRFIRATLRKADVNIVLSRRLVGMIKGKAPEARVEVLYNAVNVPTSNPYSATSRDILLLGRLGKRKGAYDLVEAVRRIDSVLPGDVRLLLCGDGEVDKVMEAARAAGIDRRVAHAGWVDGRTKERLLAGTMINVLPSYNEGLPMTILETMARGIPNISTRIASIPEVITDGETGILIEPGDIDALAGAILRLVSDTEMRLRISQASHDMVARSFSLPAAVARLKEIYRTL